jgi:hypothetical protein
MRIALLLIYGTAVYVVLLQQSKPPPEGRRSSLRLLTFYSLVR